MWAIDWLGRSEMQTSKGHLKRIRFEACQPHKSGKAYEYVQVKPLPSVRYEQPQLFDDS